MTVINTNSSALRAQNASRMANSQLSTAMERLSTGNRINSAKDDAAGLAISNSMTSQIRGMNQGIRNANDGISLAQTAEGSLSEVTNMLQRVRELAVQAKSGTYSADDRTNIQAEVTALTSQINDVMDNASFNGVKLFDKSNDQSKAKTFTIQTGANASDTVDIKIASFNGASLDATKTDGSGLNVGGDATSVTNLSNARTSAKTAAATLLADQNAYQALQSDYSTKQAASDADPTDADKATAASDAKALIGTDSDAYKTIYGDAAGATDAAKAGSLKLSKSAATAASDAEVALNAKAVINAGKTLDNVDVALDSVNTVRAEMGAAQSRLESVVNTQTNNVTNLSDARSRIQDTDFSAETTNLAKAQILSQASTAMLAQANQSAQGVMTLLR